MNDKPTFAELKKLHEAALVRCANGTLGFSGSLERESKLIALLESAIPYIKDWVEDFEGEDYLPAGKSQRARDLLKQLEA